MRRFGTFPVVLLAILGALALALWLSASGDSSLTADDTRPTPTPTPGPASPEVVTEIRPAPAPPLSSDDRAAQPPTAGAPVVAVTPGPPLPPEPLAQGPAFEAPLDAPIILMEPDAEDGFVRVGMAFATNRAVADANAHDPGAAFTIERGPTTWGYAEVSIPRDHRMGELESPNWFMGALFGSDPEHHVTLLSADPLPREDVLDFLRRELAVGDDALLLYVHGYNTDFDKAARRAGQLTYDLAWHGASVFVSWPSRAATSAYTVDRQTAEFSTGFMADVLREVADLDAGRIVVIAHSMGTYVLARALAELSRDDPEAAARISTVVLAAPDIDAEVFTTQLAPRIRALAETQVTIYASSEDTALAASRRVNGFRRLGDTTQGVTLVDGMDVIDATGTTSDFFNHTYFGDDSSILSDIYDLVNEGLPPDRRPMLEPVLMDPGRYWRVRPTD